jgi:hypothetical protein
MGSRVAGFGSEKQQCDGAALEEVAVGQEDDRRWCSTVRHAADATAVLRRHIAATQLDTRMRELSGQQWCTGIATGGTGDTVTHRRPSVHRGERMVAAG